MKNDPKEMPSAICHLDIVKVFIEQVPIHDKEWKGFQEDAKKAVREIYKNFEVISSISRPIPGQSDPCKGGPIVRIVEKYSKEIIPREIKK